MQGRRNQFEREAQSYLQSSLQEAVDQSESQTVPDRGEASAQSLFVGRIERHSLRAYCNGMARCFHGIAQAALAKSKGQGTVVPFCLAGEGERSDASYAFWSLRAGLLQRLWPLGREMQALLNDYRLQRIRGQALSVAMASMAVRLSPSFERRLCLAQALHQQGLFHGADTLMARLVSRPLARRNRALAWIQQSAFYRERGRLQEAHAASRAAATCAPDMPLAWASWLLTSALVGDLEELRSAGQGLASVAESGATQVRRFRESCAGAYAQKQLPGVWLRAMPEVAQRLLWEVFSS
ncbi:MAG: hypothetical protein ACI87O_002367 [Planctomycetota bacterium]|jgi:hypothetical protein